MKSQLVATSARQKLHWVALSCCDKNRLCKRAFSKALFKKFPRLQCIQMYGVGDICCIEIITFPVEGSGAGWNTLVTS